MMSDSDVDRSYRFDELPEETQADFCSQFEDVYDFEPSAFSFRLTIVKYEQLTEELDDMFGPNLLDYIEDDYVQELATDIYKNGLKNPPFGSEGVHRKLAYHLLERDMPRFEIVRCKVNLDDR